MLIDLYASHVEQKFSGFREMLTATGYREVIISSGQNLIQFQDDLAYPFKANPFFKEWVPLNRRNNCFLRLSLDEDKPVLYLQEIEDIWHTAPQSLSEAWLAPFDVQAYETLAELKQRLTLDSTDLTYIGEGNEFELPGERCNPLGLIHQIDYRRMVKSEYEHACMRDANKIAAKAHIVARDVLEMPRGETSRRVCPPNSAAWEIFTSRVTWWVNCFLGR